MTLFGIVPTSMDPTSQPRFVRNRSSRYESRFLSVSIADSPAIMLRGMSGARLGVWVAHGEDRCYFPDSSLSERVIAPIRYVNDAGAVAGETQYPHNPNGSTNGIDAICSHNGRHLAMMPHSERAVLPWQWAYVPEGFMDDDGESPLLKMFQNVQKIAMAEPSSVSTIRL